MGNSSLVSTLRHRITATHLRLLRLLLRRDLLGVQLLLLARLSDVVEPRVLQRLRRTDAHLRAQLQHAAQKAEAERVDLREDEAEILRRVDVEVGLVFRELADAGPRALRGSAHQAEDALQLVLVGGAGEERAAGIHLGHDAACGPDVDAGVVGAAAEQNVGRAVPQRDDLVGEGVDRDSEGAGKTKIGELQLALVVDEQVLGLEITVQDAVLVAKSDAAQQLVHERLDGHGIQLASVAARVHVFLQVLVHVLKHEHELVLGVDDIV